MVYGEGGEVVEWCKEVGRLAGPAVTDVAESIFKVAAEVMNCTCCLRRFIATLGIGNCALAF